jgi:hypothetical protein
LSSSTQALASGCAQATIAERSGVARLKWTRADGQKYDSGVWAEEFIVMDEKLSKAGFQVDLASPGGVAPTIDKLSLDPKMAGGDAAVKHFRSVLAANAARIAKPLAEPCSPAGTRPPPRHWLTPSLPRCASDLRDRAGSVCRPQRLVAIVRQASCGSGVVHASGCTMVLSE